MTALILLIDLVLSIMLVIFIKQSRFVSVKPKVWDLELDRLLEMDEPECHERISAAPRCGVIRNYDPKSIDITIKDEGMTVYDKVNVLADTV